MYSKLTVIVQCGLDGCTAQVTAEFERGEPTTYSDPGLPDQWYPYKHGSTVYTYDITNNSREDDRAYDHMDDLSLRSISGDSFGSRCDRVIEESYDGA